MLPSPIPTVSVQVVVHTVVHSALSKATLIASIAAGLTAIGAWIALFLEGRRNRLSIGIDNMWKLIEQWDSNEMRQRRAHVARSLLKESRPKPISDAAIDMLNTFELLGFLVKAKVLKLEYAWVNFSPWAVSWWLIYETEIARLREDDQTVFEAYAALVQKFITHEAQRRKLSLEDAKPKAEELPGFLEGEEGLMRRLEEALKSPRKRTKASASEGAG